MSIKTELKEEYLKCFNEQLSIKRKNEETLDELANDFFYTLLLPLFKVIESITNKFEGIRFYADKSRINFSLVKYFIPLDKSPGGEEIYLGSSNKYNYDIVRHVFCYSNFIKFGIEPSYHNTDTSTGIFTVSRNRVEGISVDVPKYVSVIFDDNMKKVIKGECEKRSLANADFLATEFVNNHLLVKFNSLLHYLRNDDDTITLTFYTNRLCSTCHSHISYDETCEKDLDDHCGYTYDVLQKASECNIINSPLKELGDKSKVFFIKSDYDEVQKAVTFTLMSEKKKEALDNELNSFFEDFLIPLLIKSHEKNKGSCPSVHFYFTDEFGFYYSPKFNYNEGFGACDYDFAFVKEASKNASKHDIKSGILNYEEFTFIDLAPNKPARCISFCVDLLED